MEKANGFTDAQRKWLLLRAGNQCQFLSVGSDGKWHRCPSKVNLQCHHIVPRGWASKHYPKDFPLNGPMNGIVLCDYHHIGKDSVHPDTYEAHMAYRAGDRDAFKKMMEKRYELNAKGIPYWNTQWDMSFHRIVQKENVSFLRTHPYPDRGKYGRTGRAK